ncbi:eCIS core domain-containing protein [Mesorhizobium sp. LjNodule214]|uniref:eCIS core domain-containing protein n=1 Tax=Mesorhizobium sp. LjNodule214 TaxID=3342252 RepID=UPI003ECCB04F
MPALEMQARVGPVDDPLEREADRVADAVVNDGAADAFGLAPAGATQRKCVHCESEELIQRKPAEAAAKAIADGGAPLSSQTRAYFEPRFGRDLSAVRIHTDDRAASAAIGIAARAYTLGSDIAFGSGEYAPGSSGGQRLIAHELAHVVQQAPPAIRRAPAEEAGKDEKPPTKVVWAAKDLLVYPLFIDLWNDIFAQKLTDAQKKEFKLKGKEGAALWNLIFAGVPAGKSLAADASFGDFLSAWLKNAEEIHTIAGGDDFYLDMFSRFVGINLDSYLGSELFKSRLKGHALALASIVALAQATLSTVQAVKEPSAKVGEFEPTQGEKQTLLAKAIVNMLLKEQIKAPDFFAIGPLKLSTHPAYAATSATAGGGPPKLTFEQKEGQGEGQGGDQLKLGLTLNLPQIIGMFQEGAQSEKDRADLQKYRGWQGSLWFSFDQTNPTLLQQQAGKLPSKAFNVGTLFGGGGFLGELEGGARYGGDAAKDLTGWFVRGGFGYSGKKGDIIQKMGFTAVYTDWTAQDIFAPRPGAGDAPVGGRAGQFTPFAKLEFGTKHKFGVGAALSFVTGTEETFNVSDFRGDFSYTYMGDRSEDKLPVFKLDLSGSVSRLDWWNPNSPLMTGVQVKGSVDKYFVAGQVNTGAGDIPEQRAVQIGEKEKVLVPTTVLFTGGVYF